MMLREQIQTINNILEEKGAVAVQKKPSFGNSPELYGFIPQFVFDAVNAVLGPEKWNHTIDDSWSTTEQFIVRVTVTIGGASHTQFGESKIIKPKTSTGPGDVGSAAKGSVTDAIQKCLALFGVGSKAYRGELKAVFVEGISGKPSAGLLGESAMLITLKTKAKILRGDVEKGRTFWKTNTVDIQTLSATEQAILAKVLQGTK